MYIKDNKLYFDKQLEFKKINGHNFVNLCGFNPYCKVGDAILSVLGIFKDEIDKKWLLRGDFAEQLVKKVYERDGHICTTYDKFKIKFDNFKDHKFFSGLIDIELLDEKTLIEVKGKSMKDYEKIVANAPKDEVYQGLLYGYLRGYKEIKMEWIFFDEESEELVFKGLKPTTLKNLKHHPLTVKVDYVEMHELMKNAIEKVRQALINGYIPLDDISEKVLEKLGFLKQNVDISDLNF